MQITLTHVPAGNAFLSNLLVQAGYDTVPITVELPFLNPVTKNELILHFISIIGELEKERST